jgi:hypothetical protein
MRGVKDTGKTLWNTTIDNISRKGGVMSTFQERIESSPGVFNPVLPFRCASNPGF